MVRIEINILLLAFILAGCYQTPRVEAPTSTLSIESKTPTPLTLINTQSSTATATKTIKVDITPTTTTNIPTETNSPGLLSAAIYIQGDENVCEKPAEMPGDIYATNQPFCIFWVDNLDNEKGFIIVLKYADFEKTYYRYIFHTEMNVTAFQIPEEYTPRLQESREQCLKHKSFTIELYALVIDREKYVTAMAVESECDVSRLPIATPGK